MVEATAFGSAIAAGRAVGLFKNLEEHGSTLTSECTIFQANTTDEERSQMMQKWEEAVGVASQWRITPRYR